MLPLLPSLHLVVWKHQYYCGYSRNAESYSRYMLCHIQSGPIPALHGSTSRYDRTEISIPTIIAVHVLLQRSAMLSNYY